MNKLSIYFLLLFSFISFNQAQIDIGALETSWDIMSASNLVSHNMHEYLVSQGGNRVFFIAYQNKTQGTVNVFDKDSFSMIKLAGCNLSGTANQER